MLPTIVLILAATAYRIYYALTGAPASWANFSPVAAILLCFGLIVLLGFALRKKHKYKALFIFAAAAAGSCLFFVVTNTATWFSSPNYFRSFEGWWQALTAGLPGYPPTLFFFRNTFLSDLLFTALFLTTQAASAKSPDRHSDAPYPEIHHQR